MMEIALSDLGEVYDLTRVEAVQWRRRTSGNARVRLFGFLYRFSMRSQGQDNGSPD